MLHWIGLSLGPCRSSTFFFLALAKHQVAQVPTSQSGSGGRSVSSDQSNTVTFHIWQTISMVTCAKLQQSCQSSLYRELGELIREKAFCQPSASKSQSFPNLPFIIFDHFDSPYFSYYFCYTQRKLSRLCSLFVSSPLPLALRVDFIFDSSTQAWFCVRRRRRRLTLPHLEGKKKTEDASIFGSSYWFFSNTSRLELGVSLSTFCIPHELFYFPRVGTSRSYPGAVPVTDSRSALVAEFMFHFYYHYFFFFHGFPGWMTAGDPRRGL